MPGNDYIFFVDDNRNLKTERLNTGSGLIHGGAVLARIIGVWDKAVSWFVDYCHYVPSLFGNKYKEYFVLRTSIKYSLFLPIYNLYQFNISAG
jgi:hypothetical protein